MIINKQPVLFHHNNKDSEKDRNIQEDKLLYYQIRSYIHNKKIVIYQYLINKCSIIIIKHNL